MAITYPLAFPTAQGIKSVRITPRSMVAVSVSPFTGAQQVQEHQGQWFEMEIALPVLTRADADEFNAFRLKLNGRRGTFLFGDPAAATPRGTIAGTVLVNGAHAIRAATLNLKGLTVGTTLKAGDYIQLGSGSTARLHKNLNDVTADAGGLVSLDIWPWLRAAYSDGAAVVYSSAKGVFRLAQNEMPWETDTALKYGITIPAVEAL